VNQVGNQYTDIYEHLLVSLPI